MPVAGTTSRHANAVTFGPVFLSLAALLLVLSACAEDEPAVDDDVAADPEVDPADDPEDDAPEPADEVDEVVPPPAEGQLDQLRVAYVATPQLSYSASRATWTLMNEAGWDVEEYFFPQPELAIQALVQGDVEFVNSPTVTLLNAVAAGEDIVGLVPTTRGEWVLVGHEGLASPADLSGTTIGVHSEISTSNLVVQQTLVDEGIDDAEIVIIPGSIARAQALEQGQIDATSLFLTDAIRLEIEQGIQISTVATYEDIPYVDLMLVTQGQFLEEHQEEARVLVEALLQTHQRMQDDPAWATDEAMRLLPQESDELVQEVVAQYLEIGVWAPDGGVETYEEVAEWIQVAKDAGLFDEDAPDDPELYMNLGILHEVQGDR
jgi:ABC-type nitrate/sulfonate/bicarbonate transport system substrate-binding protein